MSIKIVETLKNYFYFSAELTGMENAEFKFKETAQKIASNQNTELDKEHLQFNKLCRIKK